MIFNNHDCEKINIRALFSICAVATLLVVLSLFWRESLWAFGLFVLVELLVQYSLSIFILFYILPFATLLRYTPESMSLFTLLCFAEVVILLVHRRRINAYLCLILVILTGFVVLTCRENYTEATKLLMSILLFDLFQYERTEQDERAIGFSFSLGVLVSSFLAIWKDKIPRLMSMYTEIDYVYLSSGRVRRFSGTFQDPNYYTVAIILAITFIECKKGKMERKEAGLLSLMQCVLLLFGSITYSKSFFLMFIFMSIYLLLRYRSKKRILMCLLFGCAAVAIYVLDPFGIIGTVIERFMSENLTTGRVEIWGLYSKKIFEDTVRFFVGNGIGERLQHAAHNTWLQMLYEIGFIGSFFTLAAVIHVIRVNRSIIKRDTANYSGYLILVVMFSFLNGLTSYELPFYLTLVNTIYNGDLRILGKDNENMGVN